MNTPNTPPQTTPPSTPTHDTIPETRATFETEATEYAAVYPGNAWKMAMKKAGVWHRSQGVEASVHDIGFEPLVSFSRVLDWLLYSPMPAAGRDPPATTHTIVGPWSALVTEKKDAEAHAKALGDALATAQSTLDEMKRQRDVALREVTRLQAVTRNQISEAIDAKVAALRSSTETTAVTFRKSPATEACDVCGRMYCDHPWNTQRTEA